MEYQLQLVVIFSGMGQVLQKPITSVQQQKCTIFTEQWVLNVVVKTFKILARVFHQQIFIMSPLATQALHRNLMVLIPSPDLWPHSGLYTD